MTREGKKTTIDAWQKKKKNNNKIYLQYLFYGKRAFDKTTHPESISVKFSPVKFFAVAINGDFLSRCLNTRQNSCLMYDTNDFWPKLNCGPHQDKSKSTYENWILNKNKEM